MSNSLPLMKTPLVTLAIPTLRRPGYLRGAIAAAVDQTFPDLEILVSDNGNDEETGRVVREFACPRLGFRSNPTTVDIVAHYNQLLELARGKYFCLLSDDDLISANFVETLVEAFEARPLASVGLTRSVTVNGSGAVIGELPAPAWRWRDGREFAMEWLWGRAPDPRATFISMFLKRDQARQVGGFPPFRLGLHSDNALFVALALQGEVVFVPEAVFQYRVHWTSFGLNVGFRDLGVASRQFLEYVERQSVAGRRLVAGTERICARTYLQRVGYDSAKRFRPWRFCRAVVGYRWSGRYVQELAALLWPAARRALRSGKPGLRRANPAGAMGARRT